MKTLQIALVLFGFCSATAFAQAKPEPFCAAALKEINSDLREIEADKWRSIHDDSAPRAQLRQQRALVAVQKAQVNLSLMRDAKCKMPTMVYAEWHYAEWFDTCVKATEKELNAPKQGAISRCVVKYYDGVDLFK